MLMLVSICSMSIRSLLAHLHKEKVLISICQVQGVSFCAFPIAVVALLSSYRTVAASWETSRSQRTLRMKSIIFPVSYAAMNSASIVEPATVG